MTNPNEFSRVRRGLAVFLLTAFLLTAITGWLAAPGSRPVPGPALDTQHTSTNGFLDWDVPARPRAAAVISNPTITRLWAPVVLNMETHPTLYPTLQGLTTRNLRVLYYDQTNGWTVVPFQIDEIGRPYVWVDNDGAEETEGASLTQVKTYIPYGDPGGAGHDQSPGAIDADDEIMFYTYAGCKVDTDTWWNATYYPRRVELTITDPVGSGQSWMYLYYCPGATYEAIEQVPGIQDLASWTKSTYRISTPVYDLGIAHPNHDNFNYVSVKGTTGTDLVESFTKCFQRVEISTIGSGWMGSINEGVWPSGDGFANPGTYSQRRGAIDDPSDPYDAGEGNLQNMPSQSNDIEGAGDHNAVVDGLCRVILGIHGFEHQDLHLMSQHTYSYAYDLYYFYYHIMDIPRVDTGIPEEGMATVQKVYSFRDLTELNPAVRSDCTVYFGAATDNPYYAQFPGGLKACTPNGNGADDGYTHGGDPTTQDGGDYPDNQALADWVLVTSTANGGFWQGLNRIERNGHGINERNIYWHDGAITEWSFEFEGQQEDGGAYEWLYRTQFGQYTTGIDAAATGNALLAQKRTALTFGYQDQAKTSTINVVSTDTATETISPGQTGITVTVAVNNPGGTDISLSSLSLVMRAQGSTDVSGEYAVTGPSPSLPIVFSAHTMTPQQFTFTVDAGTPLTPGSITIDALASGMDLGSGQPTSDPDGAGVKDAWTVGDFDPPVVTGPTYDLFYVVGTTGNVITWTITDYSPGTYNVTQVGGAALLTDQAYTSGTPITVNVDGLAKGQYSYRLDAKDQVGNTASNTVNVTVTDQPLVITDTRAYTYDVGTTGHNVTWLGSTNQTPDKYNVTRDGVLVAQGTWASGVPIGVVVDGLTSGSYTFRCFINTTTGLSVNDSVTVTVTNVPPVIVGPPDYAYPFGVTGNLLRWTILDNSTTTPTFVLQQNATNVRTGSWTGNQALQLSIDGLGVGTYHYTLVARDGMGGEATDEVVVRVVSLQLPNGTTSGTGGTNGGTGGTPDDFPIVPVVVGSVVGGVFLLVGILLYVRKKRSRFRF